MLDATRLSKSRTRECPFVSAKKRSSDSESFQWIGGGESEITGRKWGDEEGKRECG